MPRVKAHRTAFILLSAMEMKRSHVSAEGAAQRIKDRFVIYSDVRVDDEMILEIIREAKI